jgi:hypothetical protein
MKLIFLISEYIKVAKTPKSSPPKRVCPVSQNLKKSWTFQPYIIPRGSFEKNTITNSIIVAISPPTSSPNPLSFEDFTHKKRKIIADIERPKEKIGSFTSPIVM